MNEAKEAQDLLTCNQPTKNPLSLEELANNALPSNRTNRTYKNLYPYYFVSGVPIGTHSTKKMQLT